MRSLGSYFGIGPTEHLYIDTSQGLLGFGAAEGAPSSEMITIYEGVGGVRGMMAPNRVSVGGLGAAGGCGCQAQRGRLAGFGRFGDEVPPDGGGSPASLPPVPSVGVTLGTNIQTGIVAILAAASLAVVGAVVFGKLQGQPLRANARGSAPAYLFRKKGRTGKRQRHTAAVYLGRRRQGNATKKEGTWAGRHLASARFNRNGSRQKYVVLWRHAAGTRLPGKATVATVQRLCAQKGIGATIATELGSGRLMHIGTVDKSGAFHGAQRV